MLDFFANLFNTQGFPPRWHCGLWTSGHGWLHILSDVGIWSAYYAIPWLLVYIAFRRRDVPFRALFWLFGAFILACGTIHLLDAFIFWWPAYRFLGLVKFVTAVVSWATVVALVPAVPQALTLRSPRQLEEEVRARTRELAHANESLRFLADASRSLATLVDYQSTLQTIARLGVPRFADWCTVHIVDEDGALRPLAVAHCDPAKMELVEEMGRRYPVDPDQPVGAAHVLRTGQSEMLEAIPDSLLERIARNEEHLRLLRGLGPKSSIAVPLAVRGHVIGTLTFVTAESGRRYTQADLAVAEDLAYRAATAIENARLYGQVREADRRKDEFLAMLAHELRNPLAPIRSGLDLLAMNGVEGETVQLMQEQVEHLVRLVDDLLDVSRILRGKTQLRREPVPIAVVVQRSLEVVRPLVEAQRHQLTVSLPSTAIWLEADPVRLAQVFTNLLNNAAKYTEPGGRIWLTVTQEAQQAVISVRDSGIGIEPDLLPYVFDLFTQADRSLDRSQGGLGIGLTLVRSLVQMHGGTVEAHSQGHDRGSEFVIRLPIAALPHKDIPSESQARPVAPRRILVVEDNVGAAKVLAKLLAKLGAHEIQVAHDGVAGLDLARNSRPDLVLLDIGLPGMNGYEVAKRLRQEPGGEEILLVALTGYGQEEDRRRSKEAGFDEHLLKPPALDVLRSLFEHPKMPPAGSRRVEP